MKTEGIAKFEKVSFDEYKKAMMDCCDYFDDNELKDIYDAIKLPKRATVGSAGYDFFTPANLRIPCGKTLKFPTGIRVNIENGWVLKLYPRSGLGFKYRMQLDNTVGIIDSDYYDSDNEGHIMAKFTNDGREGKKIVITKGTAYMQGIFVPFGTTVDDCATGIRNGGFGSTTQKE